MESSGTPDAPAGRFARARCDASAPAAAPAG